MYPQTEIARAEDSHVTDALVLTDHARQRMDQRGVSEQDVELALQFGRKVHSRRALFHVIGRKEIKKLGDKHPELKGLDGVQVLTSEDGESVITVYRNHDLRAIRPNKRKHRHLH
ncbi:MAG: DUF4258 domain-containing protein [Motiliproteus sp.]|nr:DUF4258 domain-containing protein [Motiliproteus sp.]MCW9053237.1 DUF4258 domain-containing protein [Motiliproteus sp.]